MALVENTAILFALMFPDIPIVYANPTTVDETAMGLIPQWKGCAALLDTMDYKILESVKKSTPATCVINDTGLMESLSYVPIVQN